MLISSVSHVLILLFCWNGSGNWCSSVPSVWYFSFSSWAALFHSGPLVHRFLFFLVWFQIIILDSFYNSVRKHCIKRFFCSHKIRLNFNFLYIGIRNRCINRFFCSHKIKFNFNFPDIEVRNHCIIQFIWPRIIILDSSYNGIRNHCINTFIWSNTIRLDFPYNGVRNHSINRFICSHIIRLDSSNTSVWNANWLL